MRWLIIEKLDLQGLRAPVEHAIRVREADDAHHEHRIARAIIAPAGRRLVGRADHNVF